MCPKGEEKCLNNSKLAFGFDRKLEFENCVSLILAYHSFAYKELFFPWKSATYKDPCSMNYLSKPVANCLLIQFSKLTFDSHVYSVIFKKLIWTLHQTLQQTQCDGDSKSGGNLSNHISQNMQLKLQHNMQFHKMRGWFKN